MGAAIVALGVSGMVAAGMASPGIGVLQLILIIWITGNLAFLATALAQASIKRPQRSYMARDDNRHDRYGNPEPDSIG